MTMFDRKRRETFLTDKITGYLDRKAPPRSLGAQAQANEMASLVRCFMRFAPKDGYEDWWPNFEDRLDEDAKTRAWPTAGEIKAAAMAITGPSSRRIAEGNEFDPLDVNAKRMHAGERVSDGYLYGRLSVELVASGKVSEAQMRRYRAAFIFWLKDTYDEPIALAKVAEFEARHAAAEAAAHEPLEPRALPKPQPKIVPRHEWDGAA
ncbi:hypothetical protein [Ruegeria meonggei]|uniref:Uncharacterized protein n=1 Tax=Ruegeria meonggei TaxID=1446476 RepID=A0A1X6YLP8_9RHOB|nr:hypothetical protein [Ruegeria meonggei]SLN25116.1 hypothetical protein RUM8411_01006 [Ruegeria meonggei]